MRLLQPGQGQRPQRAVTHGTSVTPAMKPHTTETPTSFAIPRRSARTAQPSPYLSAAETSALLHASLDSRLRRLDQADMMTTDEAAALLGTSRVTVNAWINKGRCIGLTQTKRGFKVPRWQFEPVIWDHLPGIGQALGLHEGWALLNFFETPHGGLEGLTPRQALEQGQAERVLAVAQAEGA